MKNSSIVRVLSAILWTATVAAAVAAHESDAGDKGLPVPTNDLCANAIAIGNGHYDGWTVNAGNDGGAPCGPAGQNDVWFRYTAPRTGSVVFSTCNSAVDSVISLSNVCPGGPFPILYACSASSACGPHGRIVRNVIQGEVYYIRVATEDGGFNLFDLDIIFNETCEQATVIGYGTTSGDTSVASANGSSGCGSSDTSPDLWYAFTAPQTGLVQFSTCNSYENYAFDTVLSVHSSCPGTAATALACNDDACGSLSRVLVSVLQGSTYYVRVSGYSGASGKFQLTTALVPVPQNDLCANATQINGYRSYSGQTMGASLDSFAGTTCGNANSSADVWYRITAWETRGVIFSLCSGENWNAVLSMHTGCPGTAANTLTCNDDWCEKRPEITANLVQGTTYYLRVSGNNAARGPFELNVRAVNSCALPQPVTYGSFEAWNDGAAASGSASCGNSDAGPAVWHSFVAPETGPVYFSTCGNFTLDTVLSIHTACPGTVANQLACDVDGCGVTGSGSSRILLNVVQGQTYMIRVAGVDGGTGYYRLTIAPPAPNDNCANAQTITYSTVPGSLNGASRDGQASCGVQSATGGDAWYRFTASESRTVRLAICTGQFSPALSVHSGCPGTAGNTIACSSQSGGVCSAEIFLGVTEGTDYFVRVADNAALGGNFSLVFEPIVVDFDNCDVAVTVGYGSFAGTTQYATADGGPGCIFGTSPDVWHKFTPTVAGPTTFSLCGSTFDTVMSIHSGCPPTAENTLGCDDDSGGCGSSSAILLATQIGVPYYVRVGGFGGETGSYNLTITPPPPPNDACDEAEEVGLGSNAGWNAGATTDGSTSCVADSGADVWFKFTAPVSDQLIFSLSGVNIWFDSVLSIHSACPGTSENTLACNDNAQGFMSRLAFVVSEGQTYWIRVAGVSDGIGFFDLNIGTAPANNDCENAAPIAAGTRPGTINNSTPDGEGGAACLGNTLNDVWYIYTAPSSGTVVIDTCQAHTFDTVLSLHSGCPGTELNRLACNDDFCSAGSKIEWNVVKDQSYLIRVANLGGSTGSFSLTVTEQFYNGRPYGDLNSDGCVNLDDFLILLDHWQLVYYGEVVSLPDFLNLLDNWQTCPGV